MIGIYRITNKTNGKVYIGQSMDCNRRKNQHIWDGENRPITTIDRAINKYGPDNFIFEVIEECKPEELNDREIYWIQYYDSYKNGYNETIGGKSLRDEDHPRAKLTNNDVWEIRELYNQRVPFRDAYALWKDKCSKRAFQKVWRHETWLDIHMDVYTPENQKWHKTVACGWTTKEDNFTTRKKITQEEIEQYRKDYNDGMTINAIANKYCRDFSTIKKYLYEDTQENWYANISVKNLETGKTFTSLTQAAKWANCSTNAIKSHLYDGKSAGTIPDTNEPAHWNRI